MALPPLLSKKPRPKQCSKSIAQPVGLSADPAKQMSKQKKKKEGPVVVGQLEDGTNGSQCMIAIVEVAGHNT